MPARACSSACAVTVTVSGPDWEAICAVAGRIDPKKMTLALARNFCRNMKPTPKRGIRASSANDRRHRLQKRLGAGCCLIELVLWRGAALPVARERRPGFGPERDKGRGVDERQRQRQNDQRGRDECARHREGLADRAIVLAVLIERRGMIDLAEAADLDARDMDVGLKHIRLQREGKKGDHGGEERGLA